MTSSVGPFAIATERTPLLIASPERAQHWRGRLDDGTGITIEYGGKGVEKLPARFAQGKKPGRRAVKLKTAAEADAFERELLAHFLELHPNAKRPSRYPEYPRWYVGTESNGVYDNADFAFGIERRFASHYAAMTKQLGDASVITFDKKKKASALFFDFESGAGEIAKVGDAIAIARGTSVGSKVPKRAAGTIDLSTHVVVFSAAFAAEEVARGNWGIASLVEGVKRGDGALKAPDQRAAGGACFSMTAGSFKFAVERDVLWLWR